MSSKRPATDETTSFPVSKVPRTTEDEDLITIHYVSGEETTSFPMPITKELRASSPVIDRMLVHHGSGLLQGKIWTVISDDTVLFPYTRPTIDDIKRCFLLLTVGNLCPFPDDEKDTDLMLTFKALCKQLQVESSIEQSALLYLEEVQHPLWLLLFDFPNETFEWKVFIVLSDICEHDVFFEHFDQLDENRQREIERILMTLSRNAFTSDMMKFYDSLLGRIWLTVSYCDVTRPRDEPLWSYRDIKPHTGYSPDDQRFRNWSRGILGKDSLRTENNPFHGVSCLIGDLQGLFSVELKTCRFLVLVLEDQCVPGYDLALCCALAEIFQALQMKCIQVGSFSDPNTLTVEFVMTEMQFNLHVSKVPANQVLRSYDFEEFPSFQCQMGSDLIVRHSRNFVGANVPDDIKRETLDTLLWASPSNIVYKCFPCQAITMDYKLINSPTRCDGDHLALRYLSDGLSIACERTIEQTVVPLVFLCSDIATHTNKVMRDYVAGFKQIAKILRWTIKLREPNKTLSSQSFSDTIIQEQGKDDKVRWACLIADSNLKFTLCDMDMYFVDWRSSLYHKQKIMLKDMIN